MHTHEDFFRSRYSFLDAMASRSAGRPYLVIWEEGAGYDTLAHDLGARLQELGCGALGLEAPRGISGDTVSDYADKLSRACIERGIRHGHFIAFGAICPVAQSVAVRHRKLPRSLTLIDPALRPHATFFDRVIGRVERILPLGLPLRSPETAVDVAHFLHRIRVPTAICTVGTSCSVSTSRGRERGEESSARNDTVGACGQAAGAPVVPPQGTTPATPSLSQGTVGASRWTAGDLQVLVQRLPIAWWLDIAAQCATPGDTTTPLEQLVKVVSELSAVPLKCPQKGLGGSS